VPVRRELPAGCARRYQSVRADSAYSSRPRPSTDPPPAVRIRSLLRRLAAALLVLGPLAVASIPYWLAPRTMAQVRVRIGATEYAALVAAAAVVAGVVAAWLVRRPAGRLLAAGAALATVALTAYPAWTAARAVQAPLATIDALAPSSASSASSAVPMNAVRRSPLSVRTALLGLPATPDVATRHVAYAAADGSPLDLRLFRGAACATRPCPTVVALYGGAWMGGDATQAADTHRYVASLGYLVVALDYRHAPEHPFPAQLDDVRRGLALVRDSAAAWGGDAERVVLWGRSSGGHLATLAAWDTAPGPLPVRVRGVIDFYGPFDLVRGYTDLPHPDPIGVQRVLRAFTGGTPADRPAAYRAASPASYVRPGLPPTLLVYAAHDHLVKPEFGRAEAAALRAAGVPVVHVELPFAEHGFDFVPNGADAQAALEVVRRFLEVVMR